MELKASNECYDCVNRRAIPGDCHSRCADPDPDMKGDEHGIRKGWFAYPYNFDPVWKKSLCKKFVSKTNPSVSGAVSQVA